MRNVTASATFDGRWWIFVIHDLDAVGQSLQRSDVIRDVRDLASLWLNVPLNAIHVGRVRYLRVHWSAIVDQASTNQRSVDEL